MTNEASTSFKQVAYAQETDEVFICLLTFTSPELTAPVYIASDPYDLLPNANVKGVLSNGIEYIFLPFDISLPRDDATGTVSAKLTIENTDRSIIQYIRAIRQAVQVKIQIVLSKDVDVVEMVYDNFRLSNINYDSQHIQGDLTLDYWGLEPFPSCRFTPSGWPGLF